MREGTGSMIGMIVLAVSGVAIWFNPLALKIVVSGICAFGWAICLVTFMES